MRYTPMDSTPVRRLRRSLTTENLWLYVLASLAKKDAYAYAMRDEIQARFGWKPGLIMSYVVLYRLESEGLIRSRFEGRRKYYSLSKNGKHALQEAKSMLAVLKKSL